MVTVAPIGKKRKNYFLSFFVFLVAAGIVFSVWKMFLAEPKPLSPEVEAQYAKIKINFDILQSPALETLQPYIEIEEFDGEVGRSDPFSPY